MAGGEAKRITNLKNGVSSFQWSPDGNRLVVVSRIGPSDSRPESKDRSDVRHYKNSSYKFNDTGWFDDRRNHLWVVDLKDSTAKQITEGDDWNDSDPQWSPDGTKIAFVSNRSGKEYEGNRNSDVWVMSASGGPLTKISDHDESDNSPRWSPDGRTIAFVGELHDGDHAQVWLAPATGGSPSMLATTALDLLPTALKWSGDGKWIYFESGFRGQFHLFRITTSDKSLSQISSGGLAVRNAEYNARANLRMYMINDFKHLDDLYVADLSGANERKLTNLNQALWKQLQLADVETFKYKSADDWAIDGFLVRPVGWLEGRKYPLILSVHGGPAGQYGVDWYHEFQVYAAGLRGSLHQSTRFDWLWTKLRTRDCWRMGWQRLYRRNERSRCGVKAVPMDRCGSNGCHGWQLRRIHDQLDYRTYKPIQGCRYVAECCELHFR